jgi:hypothetical protein
MNGNTNAHVNGPINLSHLDKILQKREIAKTQKRKNVKTQKTQQKNMENTNQIFTFYYNCASYRKLYHIDLASIIVKIVF